jgi:hypothetical protein
LQAAGTVGVGVGSRENPGEEGKEPQELIVRAIATMDKAKVKDHGNFIKSLLKNFNGTSHS